MTTATTRVSQAGVVSTHECGWTGIPLIIHGIEMCPVCADPDAEPPARNDPCPCGSGRKYKRCHGT